MERASSGVQMCGINVTTVVTPEAEIRSSNFPRAAKKILYNCYRGDVSERLKWQQSILQPTELRNALVLAGDCEDRFEVWDFVRRLSQLKREAAECAAPTEIEK